MTCEKQENCLDKLSGAGSKLPPLEPGETQVTNFQATTKSFLDISASMRVNITTLRQDRSLHSQQVTLPVKHDSGIAWTSALSISKTGEAIHSEALCKSGHFHCHGDESWCAQQDRSVCDGRSVRLQQRSGSQNTLQA
jgi:hypothetical protein